MPQRRLIRGVFDDLRFRSVLRSITSLYVRGRHYDDDLTSGAISKLIAVERRLVVLAIGAYAHDVRRSAASIIELACAGYQDDALYEKATLAGRVMGKWAFEIVGLPRQSLTLFELVAPLKVGLGSELKETSTCDGCCGGRVAFCIAS